MMSGEYFLTDEEKGRKQRDTLKAKREAKRLEKMDAKNKTLEAPAEDAPKDPAAKQKKRDAKAESKAKSGLAKPDINELKNKFLKKK
jgi:hypothetical protein